MWPDEVIHAFYAGSAMHGATGNKPTDIDIAGVYIQPPEWILGIPQMRVNEDGERRLFDPDVHVWKAVGHNTKVEAGEIDLNLYSLRKWANMAASGNTTALEFLFVDCGRSLPVWREIVAQRTHFLSKKAGHHFIAFAKAMLLRLNGGNTGKHGQRPELEAEFGYDTKGAMHMLRVLGEGLELMDRGEITLPCPEAPFLKDVRNGKFDREEINKIADARFEILEEWTAKAWLPDELDRAKISEIITKAQIEFWGWGRQRG
jgi:predicted nucleotidyltransferase